MKAVNRGRRLQKRWADNMCVAACTCVLMLVSELTAGPPAPMHGSTEPLPCLALHASTLPCQLPSFCACTLKQFPQHMPLRCSLAQNMGMLPRSSVLGPRPRTHLHTSRTSRNSPARICASSERPAQPMHTLCEPCLHYTCQPWYSNHRSPKASAVPVAPHGESSAIRAQGPALTLL